MRLIIAGGRDFNDFKLMEDEVEFCIDSVDEIVSGGAKGADRLGERLGELYEIPVKVFKADWNTLGKRAGFVRNEKMAEYADGLIAFWDGESKGTKNMIDIARREGLKLTIVYY